MDLSPLARLIEIIRTHPFEAIVIALAIIFVFTVFIAVGVPLARCQWQRPMVRLPPPKSPMEKRDTVLIAAAFVIAFLVVWLVVWLFN